MSCEKKGYGNQTYSEYQREIPEKAKIFLRSDYERVEIKKKNRPTYEKKNEEDI